MEKGEKPDIKTNECLTVEATTLRFNNLSLMVAEMITDGAESKENKNTGAKEIERLTNELKRCTQVRLGDGCRIKSKCDVTCNWKPVT
jgi:hypothetical protein